MTNRRLLLTLTASALPWLAQADESGAPQEIVVTATKRETVLQDTPLSLTVLGADTLKSTNADNFSDFAKLVPGLSATDLGPGNKRYALRGLQSPGEPEVALYYDEIPVAGLPGGSLDTGASQLDLKLTDVERIEVLRGPEGTLYGNGSEGGAIRILSKRPDLEQFGASSGVSGSVTEGGAPSYGVNEMINIPIVKDRLAIRIAGYYRDEGGWIDDVYQPSIALPQIAKNNLNGEQTGGVRASVTFKVTDDWTLTNIAYYQHMHTDNSFETYPSFATSGNPWVSKAFIRTPWTDEAVMDNLISTYDFDWAKLVATASYQYRTADDPTDTTRYLLSVFGCTLYNWNKSCHGPQDLPAASEARESVLSWAGEARLVSQGQGPLQWTVGGAVQNSKDYHDTQVAKADSQGYMDFTGDGTAQNRLFARTNYDVFQQYSFFGNLGYEVLDGVTADVGLRWFHSYRSDQQVILQQFFPGSPTGAEPFQSFSEGQLFKSFGLSWKAAPETLLYANASQGFRAGGPNYPGGFTATAPAYDADSVWDYEAGLKQSFADGKIQWNSSLFWIDWSNLQVILPQATFSYISNSGSARSQGFETEITAELLPGLTAIGGVGYDDARLVGPQPYNANPLSQLRAGDKLAGVPDWTANASLLYRHSLGSDYTASGRIDATYQSGRGSVVAPQNPAYFTAKSYELVDLHFRLERTDGWAATLDVDNLLDRYAELSAQPSDSNLIGTVTAARPRTITLGISKSF